MSEQYHRIINSYIEEQYDAKMNDPLIILFKPASIHKKIMNAGKSFNTLFIVPRRVYFKGSGFTNII